MQNPGENTDQASPRVLRHRAIVSTDTTASGIANSTISLNGVVTEESLRLSHFPHPPTVIPSSPLASERGTPSSTPTRSQFLIPSPATPKFKTEFRLQAPPPGSPPSRVVERQATDELSLAPSEKHSPRTLPRKRHKTNDSSRALSRRSGSAGSTGIQSQRKVSHDSIMTDQRLASDELGGVDQSLQVAASVPQVSSRDAHSGRSSPTSLAERTSPYRWHDGSSGIVVDPFEDRMLSTSFITGLLASTQNPSEENDQSDPNAKANDAVSELTYPPRSPFVARSQSPISPRLPPFPTSLQHSPVRSTSPHRYTPVHESLERDGSPYMVGEKTSRLDEQRPSIVAHSPPTNLHHPLRDTGPISNQSAIQPESFVASVHNTRPAGTGITECDASSLCTGNNPESPSMPNIDNRFIHTRRTRRDLAPSLHSTKSTKSYVSSFISGLSHARLAVINRFKVTPLPPVPTIPSTFAENIHKKEKDYGLEMLPPLVNEREKETSVQDWHRPLDRQPALWKPPARGSRWRVVSWKGRIAIGFVVLMVLGIIGILVGIIVGKKHKDLSHSNCSGNLTGATCTLDATCVCTSYRSGQCDELAQSIVSLVPTLNSLFTANYTTNGVSSAIWQTQGAPVGGNCASQAKLIDVTPALNVSAAPNRTTWVQTALLWNLVQSQDLKAVHSMQSFISSAPWNDLGTADGPVPSSSSFTLSISGFIFDFASQMVTQANVSFASDGNPSSTQLSQVGDAARSALDRMYSYASASSTQRQQALSMYWRTVLQQDPEDWSTFLSAIGSSPILLPFDATSSPGNQPISNLLGNTSMSFPPPLGCYPGLSTDQLQRVNAIETPVFGLPSTSTATLFNSSCYPDRPVYGVLDVLRLRLPYTDSQSTFPKQAAVLQSDVGPRVVLFSGGILNIVSSTTKPPNLTTAETDPRQYGTLNHLNHVLLNYLSSISDISVATALVEFILSNSTTPPASNSMLFQSLASLPTLEVAIFGSIQHTDISSAASSFSTPSGSLFFGSDQALSLRQWAINTAASSVVWAEFATSPLVVRDSSLSDSTFNSVWQPAWNYLHSHPTGVVVDVGNITNAFQATGKFSP